MPEPKGETRYPSGWLRARQWFRYRRFGGSSGARIAREIPGPRWYFASCCEHGWVGPDWKRKDQAKRDRDRHNEDHHDA